MEEKIAELTGKLKTLNFILNKTEEIIEKQNREARFPLVCYVDLDICRSFCCMVSETVVFYHLLPDNLEHFLWNFACK